MTHPSDLVELRERVAKATGPDRSLDFAIAEALGARRSGGGKGFQIAWPGDKAFRCCPWLTESADAALTLVEELLPNAVLQIEKYPSSANCALAPNRNDNDFSSASAHAATLPLAILDAALTALSQLTGE